MLVFDFDGVLANSVKEIAVTSYSAVSGKQVTSLEELPEGYLELFSVNRCRARSADEMSLLGDWCLNNLDGPIRLITAEEFLTVVENSPESADSRREKYFKVRYWLADSSPDAWLKLNPMYEPIWSTFLSLPIERRVILTNKDGKSLLEICAGAGAELQEANVYTGDSGTSKSENMKAIFTEHGPSKVHFIDDSLRNLNEIRNDFSENEVSLYFADWGYNTPDDALAAKENGYSVVSQEEFLALESVWK